MLRRLALAGMVALLVGGAACAAQPAQGPPSLLLQFVPLFIVGGVPAISCLIFISLKRWRQKSVRPTPSSRQPDPPTARSALGWYLEPWKKYGEFTGRARRKEFWFFYLGNTALFDTFPSSERFY